jgi:hypothetical protein
VQQGCEVAPAKALAGKAKLTVGYLGTFEARFRGLEDVVAVVEAHEDLALHIGGAGAIEDQIASSAQRCSRIHHYGPMAHRDGLAMLAGCDLILGLYYAEVPNHKFAAPNKYYEHLLLGKPLLTSLGTPPGEKVLRHDTGWAIADGALPLVDAIADMMAKPDVMRVRGRNAAALWRRDYADYFERRIAGDYVRAVKSLAPKVDAEGDQCVG